MPPGYFTEAGVVYSHQRKNPLQCKAEYKMETPNGIFDRVVYVETRNSIFRLLNFWNRQDGYKFWTEAV